MGPKVGQEGHNQSISGRHKSGGSGRANRICLGGCWFGRVRSTLEQFRQVRDDRACKVEWDKLTNSKNCNIF